ncbi:(2Fe-2S) ferredoxin domain-containing protein [Rhodocyclus tenuis]|uniref:(2Fe-2S) ferredoxin domain-containing protein n=2 Tax=Rhodocyclus TaxID=1064 RepID=A0A6L5JX13_RHOTE|nr:(2Fe-2S) ferredoxin domain-containing protein [Rhodocyclus gracilis]MRD73418.1 (2Fe-2S) ferredoxin domain-containing protein [Rhodocyclus gracilis]NJA88472.1 (2Fe-2S) ferredoxin domain-containing protein [Rhodocyclus gracilis]
MSYFKHHVFFCCNQRDGGQDCCNAMGASTAFAWTKERIASLGRSGAGAIRVSKAGCLGRCDIGPTLVVYPEAVWYTYVDQEDLEEIIQEHLIGGRPVERLRRE